MKPRNLKCNALLAILMTILLPGLLMASKTGTISGTVTDGDTGAPIPGVVITIIGLSQSGMTNNNGGYSIVNLPSGKQTLKASAVGYNPVEIPSITIIENSTTNVDFQMHKTKAELGQTIKVVPYSTELTKQSRDITLNSCGDRAGSNEPESIVRTKKQVFRITPTPIYPPPAHGGSAIVNGQSFDAMFFKDYGTNPFIDTEDDRLSTFAADIDDASFIMCRSYLDRGELPPEEAIRVEEFINHFKYDYESPTFGPFNIHIDGGPSPFGSNCQLIRIGVKGKKIPDEERKPVNLVFVLDVSGSMARENRLELVKQSLFYLVNQLSHDEDKVGVVVYGTNGRVALPPTSILQGHLILDAICKLHPEGSTNAEEGLRLGYEMANRNFDRRKINRVILCSDGVANVGTTSPDELLNWIKGYADRGITLTTAGFGMGNYNDILMEKLGDKGNGHYVYINNPEQARKIFIENLTGTLQVIARDVKIQVDFNPAVVRSYRLIGYENRAVADNKFRDDKEDGGEIGAGHQVTALYEVKLQNNWRPENLATVFVRFKHPENGRADEISRKISRRELARNFTFCPADLKLAATAAEFAEILGKSYWAQNSTLDKVRQLAESIREEEDRADVLDLIRMISIADRLENRHAEKDEE